MWKKEWVKQLVLACLGLAVCSFATTSVEGANTGNTTNSGDYLNAGERYIQAWREMKFGLFVHWGSVSLKRTEIGWSRGGERRGRND